MNNKKQISSKFSEYTETVHGAIWNCQVIEGGLRRYIATSYELIKLVLKTKLPFYFNESDIEKDSMGTLIDKFSKLTNDVALVADLRELVPHRNKCAHRGFAIKKKQLFDESFFEKELKILEKVTLKSESIASKVVDCYKNIEIRLNAEKKLST